MSVSVVRANRETFKYLQLSVHLRLVAHTHCSASSALVQCPLLLLLNILGPFWVFFQALQMLWEIPFSCSWFEIVMLLDNWNSIAQNHTYSFCPSLHLCFYTLTCVVLMTCWRITWHSLFLFKKCKIIFCNYPIPCIW